MIEVRENKKKNANEFQIVVVTNMGEQFFTLRAAKELRDKLSSTLANIKNKEESCRS